MQHSFLFLGRPEPRDPDLITFKAVKALKAADLVLNDALIDPALLHYCSSPCVVQDAGKEQEDIRSAKNRSAI